MSYTVACLPGDGIGPEVTAAARLVAEAAAGSVDMEMVFSEADFGGVSIDRNGDPFPEQTRKLCADADAVLLGAVGGPRWDGATLRPEQGLLDLRKSLGVFANLRPVRVGQGQESLSPLKDRYAAGTDMLIVRELTGGVYFGDREEGPERASDLCVYTRTEIERVARVAFDSARRRKGRLTSVDKANVLATSRLWRAVVKDIHENAYADIELEHMLVDAMAMKLVREPAAFDVILTENMFGDILSDEASVLAGSIGFAPSASLGTGKKGLYEPIHGSAPDIAGQDRANPAGAIMSAAMMFRYSFDRPDLAGAIEGAVSAALADGAGTPDAGGTGTTSGFTRKVLACL